MICKELWDHVHLLSLKNFLLLAAAERFYLTPVTDKYPTAERFNPDPTVTEKYPAAAAEKSYLAPVTEISSCCSNRDFILLSLRNILLLQRDLILLLLSLRNILLLQRDFILLRSLRNVLLLLLPRDFILLRQSLRNIHLLLLLKDLS